MVRVRLPIRFMSLQYPRPTINPSVLLLRHRTLVLPDLRVVKNVSFSTFVHVNTVNVMDTVIRRSRQITRGRQHFGSFSGGVIRVLVI